MSESVNVLCLKYGTKYPAHYVNRLYAGVKRHLKQAFRFVCVTEDPTGVRPEVECVPFSEDPHVLDRSWPNICSKLTLFKRGFADLRGPTLFLDIDLLVIGPLDRFMTYKPGDFCIIHNWVELRKRWLRKLPFIGNSSCFRFDAGSDAAQGVYESFMRDKDDPALENFFKRGSQKYQTRAMAEHGNVTWWPNDWVASFKRDCVPVFPFNKLFAPRFPKGASIIAFHGRPDLPEVFDGYYVDHDGIPVKTHLTCRPAPWVKEVWENESLEFED